MVGGLWSVFVVVLHRRGAATGTSGTQVDTNDLVLDTLLKAPALRAAAPGGTLRLLEFMKVGNSSWSIWYVKSRK